MSPVLIHSLVYGMTWDLSCPQCRRQIAVDDIRMVETVDHVRDFDAQSMLRRAKCKECGERLKKSGGCTLGSLKHTGTYRSWSLATEQLAAASVDGPSPLTPSAFSPSCVKAPRRFTS
jgi:hypothetical protein